MTLSCVSFYSLLLVLLHSHNHIQLYTYTCGNKINNNDERIQFFRKNIPLTLYAKWLRKGLRKGSRKGHVWEVSWGLNKLQHIDPQFLCLYCPVSWGCRIHWLHLCRGVRPPPPNECPRYDTKQSDGERVPAVLELWGMRSTPFIAIAPRSTLARSGSTWQGPYLWVK